MTQRGDAREGSGKDYGFVSAGRHLQGAEESPERRRPSPGKAAAGAPEGSADGGWAGSLPPSLLRLTRHAVLNGTEKTQKALPHLKRYVWSAADTVNLAQ